MECPNCGRDGFVNIGRHWSSGKCSHPELSDYQKEILTGMVMGDGSVHYDDNNPRVQCRMISKNYLQYVDEEMGIMGTG